MINITEFFIKNKILLIVLTLILCLGGIFSYRDIKRNEDPGFKIRTATITTKCPNMNARQVDKYVSQKIEDVILEMDEVEHIKVQSYDGLSMIFVDVYETYTNIQPIWDKLRRKVDKIRPNLPNGLSPFVNDEFADVYGTIIAMTGDGYSFAELKDIADDIKDEFLTLDNVGKSELMGVQKEVVYLNFNPNDAIIYKINHALLKNYLQKTNILGVGGFVDTGGNNILIEGTSNFNEIEDLKNIPVSILGKSIKLSDIYTIKKGYVDPPENIIRSNGKDAILFILSMKENGNILKWTEEVKKEIKQLKANYPIGINFEIQAMQGEYVKILTDKFTSSLIQSVVIVIALVLFILGIKTGIIIGGIILCIILSTIFIMEKSGLGLDKISLSALIISLGILVDNSIVVAEGALQNIKNAVSKDEIQNIIIKTTRNFQTPLLCVSIITSLAFLPIYLAKSAVSEYASSLFKVVFITLMFSWFYSTTLLPYLILTFLKNKKTENTGAQSKKEIKITKFFAPLVRFSINNPKKSVFVAGMFLIFSFLVFSFVPKIFFPDSDRSMFEIRVNLPETANIFKTKETIIKIENFIKNEPEIKNFSSYIGTSAPRHVLSSSPVADRKNFGMILVNTDNFRTVDKSIKKVKKFINDNFSDVNSVVRKVPLGPPYDAPVEIRIYGYEADKIFKYVYSLQEKLKNIPGVYLVKNDWGYKTPRIRIKIDNAQASRLNLTSYDILSSIRASYEGEQLSSYYEDTTNIPIIYKMSGNFINTGNNVNSLEILSEDGKVIPVSQAAKTELKFEYPKIFRRDNRANVTIQGWIDETTTANAVIEKMLPKLDKTKWEFGYGYEIGGSYENSKKGNKSITDEIPTAFGAILLILITLFNGIKKPVIIALCAVMALSGANIGLFITHSYFGFMTFLGYICLVGIATNNCVILLDSIKGNDKFEIQKAVRSRIVPVFLTAVTTIGGMLPLWIGRDPMFSSLAISIIFGLLSSVLITLLIAPALYIILKAE